MATLNKMNATLRIRTPSGLLTGTPLPLWLTVTTTEISLLDSVSLIYYEKVVLDCTRLYWTVPACTISFSHDQRDHVT